MARKPCIRMQVSQTMHPQGGIQAPHPRYNNMIPGSTVLSHVCGVVLLFGGVVLLGCILFLVLKGVFWVFVCDFFVTFLVWFSQYVGSAWLWGCGLCTVLDDKGEPTEGALFLVNWMVVEREREQPSAVALVVPG